MEMSIDCSNIAVLSVLKGVIGAIDGWWGSFERAVQLHSKGQAR